MNTDYVNENHKIYQTEDWLEADALLKIGWNLQGVYVKSERYPQRATTGDSQYVVVTAGKSTLIYVLLKVQQG